MSIGQAYQLLRAAGFSAPKAIIMTAIGISESGLRTEAVGDVGLENNVWGPSVGFLQVRTVKAQTGTGGTRDIKVLTGNPAAQARAGFEISNGGRQFSPWSTFTSGAYAANLPKVAAAVTGSDAAAPVAPAPTGGDGGGDGQAANTGTQTAALKVSPASLLSKLLGLDDATASVAKLLVTGVVLAAGVAMVVLGAYRGVQPAVQKIQSAAAEVGAAVATDGASLATSGAAAAPKAGATK